MSRRNYLTEVDSVLPADPEAPSRARTDSTSAAPIAKNGSQASL